MALQSIEFFFSALNILHLQHGGYAVQIKWYQTPNESILIPGSNATKQEQHQGEGGEYFYKAL